MMPFGKRLKKIREKRGMTVNELSEKAQVGKVQIRYYERTPDSYPYVETAIRLAKALRVSLDFLIGTTKEGKRVELGVDYIDRECMKQHRLGTMLNHDDFGYYSGVSRCALRNWEKGVGSRLQISLVIRAAKYLGITVEEYLGRVRYE